jgi:hypothetical protein
MPSSSQRNSQCNSETSGPELRGRSSLAERGREQVYFADASLGSGAVQQWAVRTDGDPAKYANAIREAMKGLNSKLLITASAGADADADHESAAGRSDERGPRLAAFAF